MACSLRSLALELEQRIRSLTHDKHAIGDADDLRKLGGDDDDRFTLCGEAFDQAVNLGFRSDASSSRVGSSNNRIWRNSPQSNGDDRLRWFPAGKEADRPVDLKRSQVDIRQDLRRLLAERARRRMKPRGAKCFIEGSATLFTTERCGMIPPASVPPARGRCPRRWRRCRVR